MLKNMCLFLKEIDDNLHVIEDNLNKLKSRLVSTDKDYHICEIYNHIQRIRYHLQRIDGVKEVNNIDSNETMTREERLVRNSCDISAEVVEKKLSTSNVGVNFRDKKIRKASSWKYLTEWEAILEEQWSQQNKNQNEYDYTGINLVVPKRKQSIRRKKQMVSSTKEDFLDNNDLHMRKCNSTECILDRDNNNTDPLYNNNLKKCVSENDLLDDSSDSAYLDNIYNCNYLLSLKDLERIGNLTGLSSKEENIDVEKEYSKSSHDVRTTNTNNSFHKPKIVGVIYKMRL